MAQKPIVEVRLHGDGLNEAVARGDITQADADAILNDARTELHGAVAALAHLAAHRYVIRVGDKWTDL